MRLIKIVFIVLSVFAFSSCKKFLDQKPSKDTVIPSRLSDLQSLLDNFSVMNWKYDGLLEGVTDNITATDWAAIPLSWGRIYIWDPNEDIATYEAWSYPYEAVLYSNIVWEQLPGMEDADNTSVYNDVKGQALFFRSFAFWNVAQLFCRPYSSSAATDPGIVLRLASDINIPSVRSTVQQTYDQIIGDLQEAAELLPEDVIAPSRPNKAAAYGLLARVYLSMRDYVNAGIYAGLCLDQHSSLLDFNSLDSNSTKPIPLFHAETIFWAMPNSLNVLSPPYLKIDSNLYFSYDINDLRKNIYFQQNILDLDNDTIYTFKGSYGSDQAYTPFYGIATDEIYLIRAECYARDGNVDSALDYLNTLLEKRWKAGTFSPITAANASAALDIILVERRKELVYRGLRWSDLRRLNLEGANITLTRDVNGTLYTLPPNDLRWVLLIPQTVIALSDIEQNPR